MFRLSSLRSASLLHSRKVNNITPSILINKRHASDHHHPEPINEPGGYLFGVKASPPPSNPNPNQGTRKPYFWEYGFYVGYVLPFIIYGWFEYYRPLRMDVIYVCVGVRDLI
jgi:hypothetical protein